MARPRKVIDWNEVDKLCFLQCTRQEVAWFLDISTDTLDRTIKRDKNMSFAAYFEQKASKGRISLRRKQYEIAMHGNVTMLIWLGKQWLNQTEKVEQKVETNVPEIKIGWADEDVDPHATRKNTASEKDPVEPSSV